ncbi:MAG: class I SAM-dependent methyltransferase [Pseudomonadota bacterium]
MAFRRLKRLLRTLTAPEAPPAPPLDLSNLQVSTKPKSPIDLAFEDSIRDSFEAFREEMLQALMFPQKGRMRTWCMDRAIEAHGSGGLYLEFGVFRADGLNHFARRLARKGKDQNLVITGFDSLKGLSEDWTGNHNGREAGAYSVHGKMPKLEPNASLRDGWVQDTLPGFLEEHGTEKIAFAHLDFDTYTPTAYALEQIRDRLIPGTVLLFDELYGYPGWRHHEYKALKETLPDDAYRYLCFSRQSVGIEMVRAV